MATPKRFENYPEEWFEMMRETKTARMIVTLENRGQARSWRNRYYEFKRQVMIHSENPELLEIARLLQVKLKGLQVILDLKADDVAIAVKALERHRGVRQERAEL